MYAFAIVVGILGPVIAICALPSVILWWDAEHRVLPALLTLIALVAGVWGGIWGIGTASAMDREACKSHGFAWINGSCYGGNVNVNGGPK